MRDTPTDQHFFVASALEWRTTCDGFDLPDLIRYFEAGGFPYHLWLVPLPPTAEYPIKNYNPQVPDAVYLGTFTPDKDD